MWEEKKLANRRPVMKATCQLSKNELYELEYPCSGSIPKHDTKDKDGARMHNCLQFYNEQVTMEGFEIGVYWKMAINGCLAFALLFIISTILKKFGVKNTCKKIFYILSLHWLLKFLISFKEKWSNFKHTIDENVRDIVENDEELANAMVDSHDSSDVAANKKKGLSYNQQQKQLKDRDAKAVQKFRQAQYVKTLKQDQVISPRDSDEAEIQQQKIEHIVHNQKL